MSGPLDAARRELRDALAVARSALARVRSPPPPSMGAEREGLVREQPPRDDPA